MLLSQKTLYLFDGGGLWPVSDGLGFLRVHLDVALGDNEPEEGDLRDMELTLLRLDIEMVLEEALKDLADMVDMLMK